MTDDPRDVVPSDIRTAVALVVSGALTGEGWQVTSTACYAVADAILARPGMLRAALDPAAIPYPDKATESVCAVCGQGGFWVGFVPRLAEHRCLNHLDDDDEP